MQTKILSRFSKVCTYRLLAQVDCLLGKFSSLRLKASIIALNKKRSFIIVVWIFFPIKIGRVSLLYNWKGSVKKPPYFFLHCTIHRSRIINLKKKLLLQFLLCQKIESKLMPSNMPADLPLEVSGLTCHKKSFPPQGVLRKNGEQSRPHVSDKAMKSRLFSVNKLTRT